MDEIFALLFGEESEEKENNSSAEVVIESIVSETASYMAWDTIGYLIGDALDIF